MSDITLIVKGDLSAAVKFTNDLLDAGEIDQAIGFAKALVAMRMREAGAYALMTPMLNRLHPILEARGMIPERDKRTDLEVTRDYWNKIRETNKRRNE